MKKVAEADRPVGPPMKGREGIEFLVKLAGLELEQLTIAGLPANVADFGHAAGVFYELCRFTQTSQRIYAKWVGAIVRNPVYQLQRHIVNIRRLLSAVADGVDFEFGLGAETKIRVFGSQFRRTPFRTPLPFVIWSPTQDQALIVTAVFYLGLNRDSCLIRRCKEEGCGKLFIAVRKSRMFCSHECASAASVRRFREKQRSSNHGTQA